MVTLNKDDGAILTPITIQPSAISCSDEELVEVELDALHQGTKQARTDGAHHLTSMEAMMKAATVACNRALEVQYLPLDERRFREVFTLSWCAGYRSETRLAQRSSESTISH